MPHGPRDPLPSDRRARQARSVLALLVPWLALAVQSAFWTVFQPFVWFLFYPAVFVSSWLGSLAVGLLSTIEAAALVWYFFLPPVHSWAKPIAPSLTSVAVFVGMGALFSLLHRQLRRARDYTTLALQAERTARAEIQTLYRKTKELDELKTRFFAGVSHELRTPLTLIVGPTDQLLDRRDLPADVRSRLEVVARNARTLLGHVTDLLDMARLQDHKAVLAYAEVDLVPMVRAIASHFEHLARERNTALTLEAPPSLPLQADPEKLRRVLLNLLGNAFKFTPAGGKVRVTLQETVDRVLLQVADSGPGIPPEHRQAVFERFRQLDAGQARRFGGTGLGLSIVRDFVTLHQGTVQIGDAPEGGALMVVDLPRLAPAGTPVSPSRDDRSQPGPDEELRQAVAGIAPTRPLAPQVRTDRADGPLVLVVEDNADMCQFICDTVGQRYRAVGLLDSRQALARALELRPDVILTDAMMPGVSGEDLVHAVRAEKALNSTPILVVTASGDEDLQLRLLKGGAQDYVTKPFSVEELLARVSNLVAGKLALEAQARLASIIETTDDAVVSLTLDGTIRTWNPAAERLYGYTAAEIIGQTFHRLVPQQGMSEFSQRLDVIAHGGRAKPMEALRLRKDGSLVPVQVVLSPVLGPDGEVLGLSSISRDISPLMAAQRALRASEAKFSGIVALAGDAIVSIDASERVTLFNTRAEQVFGWKAAEVLGQPLDVLIPDRFRQVHHQHVASFAADPATSRQMTSRRQIIGLRKDGEEFPVEAAISKLDVGGTWLFTVVVRDVTERVRAAAERERLITELQQALAEVKTLSGLVPICAWCKKVRDDQGFWRQVESYVSEHTQAQFSHGICPDCRAKLEQEDAAALDPGRK